MEVVVPSVSSQSLHHLSAPSSPRNFGYPLSSSDCYYYTSAPTSPSRSTEFSFNQAFAFSGQLTNNECESSFAAADELFEGGMIRPLNPNSSQSQPSFTSPLVNIGKELITEQRGRSYSSLSTNYRIEARSLSPVRGHTEFPQSLTPSSQTSGSLARGGGGSKKWRLKDFFLFRSASEGRATGRGSKDLLCKYTLVSAASSSSDIKYSDANNGSMRKGRGPHERHYLMNRAASEEKKKTPLPFHRNTLFGYLRSNAAIHSISRRWNANNDSHGNKGRS